MHGETAAGKLKVNIFWPVCDGAACLPLAHSLTTTGTSLPANRKNRKKCYLQSCASSSVDD